ncbi:hypothetical protein SAMN05216327_111174 [Dyadobacter sp. SG02]|nr:hypothetical protein SAMN05216327_111174 [Dyadobacter sp. SG02]
MKESISRKVFIPVGILLSLGVLLSFILWLKLTLTNQINFETARQLYLSNYPPFIRNARVLTRLHIIFNVLAITCLLRAPLSSPKLVVLVRFFVMLNVVMMIWQIFSLM